VRPDQSPGVVVNDHRQIPVPALVADLIDADPTEPSEPVDAGLDVG